MKDTFLLAILMFTLAFLFQGDPDLWDLLHQKAMLWAGGKHGN